jgi:1,4-alpha-glucan branching enzyme
VHNFSPNYVKNYHLNLPNAQSVVELFNSDAEAYGGSGKTNSYVEVDKQKATFQLAPLSTMIFQVHYL